MADELTVVASQAQQAIHRNDIAELKRLLSQHPALLAWRGGDMPDGLVGFAAGAYGDAFGAEREHWFTRAAPAEILIDAGAVVTSAVVKGLLQSRAVGLLHMFERKGMLPKTLLFRIALGQIDAVRTLLDASEHDIATLSDAFICACRFEHAAIASLLFDRIIALDPGLVTRIDDGGDRRSFITLLMDKQALDFDYTKAGDLWNVFVIAQVMRSFHDSDIATLERLLQREPWLLGDEYVWFQNDLISKASYNRDREAFISALLDRDAGILHRQPPPASEAITYALTYANPQLIPLLTRVWPVPDDLPYAAGMGDLANVKRWFEASAVAQRVLDTALAYSVINRHFEIADYLLAHGANINTDWNSHEPASILHHLVFLPDPYESMKFLIDRGIDMQIKDYRWDATAEGWARYGNGDEKMAEWLAEMARTSHTRPRLT